MRFQRHLCSDVASLVGGVASTAIVNTGPTISKVGVSEAKGTISWNVYDSGGVKATSLKVDGKIVTDVSGPYKADVGPPITLRNLARFRPAATLTRFARATSSGVVSTLTGSFTLRRPDNLRRGRDTIEGEDKLERLRFRWREEH